MKAFDFNRIVHILQDKAFHCALSNQQLSALTAKQWQQLCLESPQNTPLKEINLHGNSIHDSGIEYLSLALPKKSTLQPFNIKNKQVVETSAQYIGHTTQTNPFLLQVNLKCNHIDNHRALYFLHYLNKSLQDNPYIQQKNLKYDRGNILATFYQSLLLTHNHTFQLIHSYQYSS